MYTFKNRKMKNNKIGGGKMYNRRYYLHRRIKMFAKMRASKRLIFIPVGILESCSARQRKYIDELLGQNYSVQTTIE